jgi:hypothetical protein
MTINVTRRAALMALASCAAFPGYAEPSRAQSGEFVTLDKPAVFEMNPNTGSLKESVQKGQQLVWHSERQAERRPISNYEHFRSVPSRAKRGSSEDHF